MPGINWDTILFSQACLFDVHSQNRRPPDECQQRLVESAGVEERHPDEGAEDRDRQLDADVVRGPLGLHEAVVEEERGRHARDEAPSELNLRTRE